MEIRVSTLDALLGEQGLLEAHALALGEPRPELDVPFYRVLESCGALVVLTAHAEKRIVGYVTAIVRKHPHAISLLCGWSDAVYLEPEFRKGLAGYLLLQAAWDRAQALGAKRLYWDWPWKDIGDSLLLRRGGFKPYSTIWMKEL